VLGFALQVDDKQITEAIHEDVQQLHDVMSIIKDDLGQIVRSRASWKRKRIPMSHTNAAPVDLEAMQKMFQATLMEEIKQRNQPKETPATRMRPWEINRQEIQFDVKKDLWTGENNKIGLGVTWTRRFWVSTQRCFQRKSSGH